MYKVMAEWYRRYFTNPEVVVLLFALIFIIFLVTKMGGMLAPVFAALVFSYLLQSLVNGLERARVPRVLAVIVVYIIFWGCLIFGCFWLFPILWRQLSNLVNELPQMVNHAQTALMTLPQRYPNLLTADQVQALSIHVKTQLAGMGQWILSFSMSSIAGLLQIIIYLILVPLLVYFFLMDKKQIVGWFRQFMPEEKRLMVVVWNEVHLQLGNYVRGKVVELLLVSGVTFISFALLDLQYSSLLAVLVGISVIIPYIGAVLVTIPVVIVALMQWGISPHFWYLILVYTIIIAVDGNVLVPVLFSEVMNIHPIAIILALLIFGGMWGFWGVFFAIPLATVVKALLSVWFSDMNRERVEAVVVLS